MYNDQLVTINSKKRTTKNSILDMCTKAAFYFNYFACDQIEKDGIPNITVTKLIMVL